MKNMPNGSVFYTLKELAASMGYDTAKSGRYGVFFEKRKKGSLLG